MSTVKAPIRLPSTRCCSAVPSPAYSATASPSLPVYTWYVRSSTITRSSPSHPSHAQVLGLEPFVDAVLRSFPADARLLHAAERRDLGRDDAGVDAEDAVLQGLGHAPDPRHVAAVEVARQAIGRVVGLAHRLVLGGEAADPRHGPERLLAADRHRVGDAGQHRGREELPAALVALPAE